ncbi:MAG: hypothetical protein Q7R96_01995 [Nanoarchaeota archaeon]|nr:hypothetical protein [Nanoarchaeota archaeon]
MTLVTEVAYTYPHGEITNSYNTRNIPTYLLALKYLFRKTGKFFTTPEDKEKLREALEQRVINLALRIRKNSVINDLPVPAEKPLKKVLGFNALTLITRELDLYTRTEPGWEKDSLRYIPTEAITTYDEKSGWAIHTITNSEKTETNRAIFNFRLQRRLGNIVTGAHTQQVCDDYELAQTVARDPDQFPKLEQLCKGPLHHFMTYERIRILDEESQHQEGLLALWQAIKNYRAENFARLTTYARKVLHHKYCNLLAYSEADCRKVNKRSIPMGGGCDTEDTPLAHELGNMQHQLWRAAQREQVWQEQNNNYNPFASEEQQNAFQTGTSDTSYDPFATRLPIERRIDALSPREERHAIAILRIPSGNLSWRREIITDDNYLLYPECYIEIETARELERWENFMNTPLPADDDIPF